jgi:hypothetical protein
MQAGETLTFFWKQHILKSLVKHIEQPETNATKSCFKRHLRFPTQFVEE